LLKSSPFLFIAQKSKAHRSGLNRLTALKWQITRHFKCWARKWAWVSQFFGLQLEYVETKTQTPKIRTRRRTTKNAALS